MTKALPDIAPCFNVHQDVPGPGDARPVAFQIVKDQNLIGKLGHLNIVITGGNSGLGKETTRALHTKVLTSSMRYTYNFVDVDPVEEILRREPEGVRRSFDATGYEAVNHDLVNQEDIVMQWVLQVTGLRGGIGVGVWSLATNSSATPRGSLMKQNMTFPIANFFTQGLRLQSGTVDPLNAMPTLTRLIANGQASSGFIVSSVINIEEAPAYYRRFNNHEELKVVIQF
ncbi:hypothetical protein BC1G_09493 [Paecilomyces variotii No. 5]|uniref:Alcohol dehydrogenase n=1 Tax=Byssochlamys spectabilis (strain No. 5 / NBRC 109023) TaxID=1356009 RepID=V5F9G9_BYSSN|nr:hypothetical protein BC1G_09493 [Paecilomyces variotii No. 5]